MLLLLKKNKQLTFSIIISIHSKLIIRKKIFKNTIQQPIKIPMKQHKQNTSEDELKLLLSPSKLLQYYE